MRIAIFGFALGVWGVQQLAALPSVVGLLLLGFGGAGGLYLGQGVRVRWRMWGVQLLCGVLLGGAWAGLRAEWRLQEALPEDLQRVDIVLEGWVNGLPQFNPEVGSVRFGFVVERAVGGEAVPRHLLLSWYARGGQVVPALRPGERWQLKVRLKRPHGFSNPHGFDYEAWLLERGVRATGHVRADAGNQRVDSGVHGWMNRVHRLRGEIRERFAQHLPDAQYAGILTALVIGDQRGIDEAQWQVFRSTGVAHLVAISGMHVSMMAVLCGGMVGWLWRRSVRLMLWWPARKASVLAGLVGAAGYALLAGLGLPTQRALVMLSVAAVGYLCARETLGSRLWAQALLVVLLIDPWAVLSAGFWLSFAAVGAILFVMSGRTHRLQGWRAVLQVQLAISLLTAPLLLLLFNALPLVSLPANLVAIPMMTLAVAPLALLAMMPPLTLLLDLAHWILSVMMLWLEWLASWPLALWQQAALPPGLMMAVCGLLVWAMLPAGTPSRVLALCMVCLVVWSWSPPRPESGEFVARVLDVGNGMAVHVSTSGHDLLYDTGPPYGASADAGSRVILPYLRGQGVSRLNAVVLSHDDIDHTGGAATVQAAMPVERWWFSPGAAHAALRGRGQWKACVAGEAWVWDGVRFEWLHPGPGEGVFRRDNDSSCVLRVVAASGRSLLLAGDVERAAEASLLRRERERGRLGSDVVLVPHHGSRSSSSPDFVKAVAAQHAVHSAGYLNAFGHPHPEVLSRWSQAGARNWRTDLQGAVRVHMGDDVSVSAQRSLKPRYWRALR